MFYSVSDTGGSEENIQVFPTGDWTYDYKRFLCHWLVKKKTSLSCIEQAPFFWRPISPNLGFNFNLGFFFFYPKTFSWIIFFYSLQTIQSPNCRRKEFTWICFFSFHISEFKFTLTLGFLNSALNNLAQALKFAITFLSHCWKKSSTPAILWAGSCRVLLAWGHYLLV